MKLGDLVELDVIRGYSKFEQKNEWKVPIYSKKMDKIHDENCMGLVGVDSVRNSIFRIITG